MRFTLARKLWLVLGTMMLLVVGGALLVTPRMHQAESAVHTVVNEALPRTSLAQEVEIDLVEATVGALGYLESPRRALRQATLRDLEELEGHAAALAEAVGNDEVVGLATRFEELALDAVELAEERRAMDRRLAAAFETALGSEEQESALALARLRSELSAFRRIEEPDREERVLGALQRYRAVGVSTEELEAEVLDAIEMTRAERRLVSDLVATRDRLDALLDEEIQPAIAAGASSAAEEAAGAIRQSRLIRLLTLAGLLTVVVSSVVVLRFTLVDRILDLSGLAQRLGEGDLDARIEMRGSDEVAEVARAFNVMAARRQEAERELAESRSRLAAHNAELRELDGFKDQFVAGISHDLRTPLTPIVAYAELLLDGEPGPLTDEQREFLEIMNRAAQRLMRLVDDLLLLARLDAGAISFQPAAVDLAGLAQEVVADSRLQAERKTIALSADCESEAWCLGDRAMLVRTLDNLLGNAIKFTPDGGSVRVSVRQDGGRVIIEVADDGVGVPEREHHRLFDRFYRASSGSGIQGSGIGLTIVKAVTEAHGGRVGVESAPGRGTTFRVDLPALQPSRAEVPA